MKSRIHKYVTKKNVALWLTVVCMLASAAARIAVFSQIEGVGVWRQIVWPVTSVLLYALIAVLFGEERLYKTAIPVWMLGGCFVWQLFHLSDLTPITRVMACICALFFCTTYTSVIGGRHKPWLLFVLYAALLGGVGCVHYGLLQRTLPLKALYYVLPAYLLILGLFVLLFAMKVHTDGRYHPTWGDRADGRRIRSTPPIDQIGPYIMVNRTGANNLFAESVEVTELERYVRRKRREGASGFGLTHVILAAYVRTVAKYPALNRFIAGQKVYSRGDDIAVSMTVKKELNAASPDTVIKVHFNPRDTVDDVYRKFNAAVEEAKGTPLDSDVDNTAGILTMVPGVVLKFVVWLLKTLDYFGQVPASLLEISPFHGSAYFTSMGSLGIRPVYHHLYDFGTIPVFCAFGRKRRAEEIVDGEIVERRYMDLKFNLDERICDGYYYASLIKYFLRLLSHPDLLDRPPEQVEQDVP